MKRILLVALTFVFCLSMACTAVYAADLDSAVDKLADGTMEMIKSPLALYDHTKASIDDADNKALGLMKGLLESPFHMAKKFGHGALDVVTFPID